jgi:NADPH2:quinone reductase
MQAVLCREFGDPSAIRLEEVASPPMGDGEVRIAVKAAGVNFPDILMIEGKYQVKPGMPFIPGLEVAGEVLECGAGVSHVRPGQRVLAFARAGGGYASEIVLPAAIVTPIPDSMDFVTAAAFTVAYGTAHFALTHRGNLQPGETLLVLGATGGVGIAAIEVGKMLGARVIAAARGEEKLAIAREHGTDEVIDYEREDLRLRLKELTDDRGVDVVFDPVSGNSFTQSMRAIAWEGRILVIGFASGDIASVPTNLVLVKNFSVIGVVFGAHSDRFPEDTRRRFAELFEYYAAGKLKPRVWKTFALQDAHLALAEISSRRVIGKMVLTP